MLVLLTNREDPDQVASSDLGLRCFLCLFGRQLVFEILEHLLYDIVLTIYMINIVDTNLRIVDFFPSIWQLIPNTVGERLWLG